MVGCYCKEQLKRFYTEIIMLAALIQESLPKWYWVREKYYDRQISYDYRHYIFNCGSFNATIDAHRHMCMHAHTHTHSCPIKLHCIRNSNGLIHYHIMNKKNKKN